MANLSKIRRDQMIGFLEELKQQHNDDASIRAFNEIENHLRDKKYGLVWEEHSEEVDDMLKESIPILTEDPERRLCKDDNAPWNFIIEGDNLQALYLLNKTHRGKIDCIYMDPPYNSGAHDWKYNNRYVGPEDEYRHSLWLSMIYRRLILAKQLLNPQKSILICTIDEKEYLHLGCLFEELFPDANIQMVSSVINVKGSSRKDSFARTAEYIFFVQLGDSRPEPLPLGIEWLGNIQNTTRDSVRLADMMRHGPNGTRSARPNLFYPIFVSKDGKRFLGAGDPLPINVSRDSVLIPDDAIAIWPIHSDGSEGSWGYSSESLLELQRKGYLHLGKLNKDGRMGISFIQPGWQKRIEAGEVQITGHGEDGFIIYDDKDYKAKFVPGNSWAIPSHNATEYGQKLLQNIVGTRFAFPKSLYAVHDTLNFFVSSNKDAIILDFFAGSGTTQHAVNLINAEDGGNRRCIMVTNNEISESEEKQFTEMGLKKGDIQWEDRGIAKYVTWPRTVCSINGTDINGALLKGNYLNCGIPMSKGFNTNVKYFKCDWTPRKPEDYLLSNMLCLHIKEMIELQNAIEVDNVKNVLLLNKADVKTHILDREAYDKIERVWVNQNIVLSARELKLLEAKGYKYIPKEFFGQELREAAE